MPPSLAETREVFRRRNHFRRVELYLASRLHSFVSKAYLKIRDSKTLTAQVQLHDFIVAIVHRLIENPWNLRFQSGRPKAGW